VAAAAQAETETEMETGHKSLRQHITHRPPRRLQSRSLSREPSSFSPAGSHCTTAGSSPPKKNAPPGPLLGLLGPGTKMDDILPAAGMLKRRSFLHAAALCSVGLRRRCLPVIVVLRLMIWCITIASQKSRQTPFILLMFLQVLRTLAAHHWPQSPANERAN
jgi:hypothetical protein